MDTEKMGRDRARPSLNFIGFLARKGVHVALKKGPPFLDTHARPRQLSKPISFGRRT